MENKIQTLEIFLNLPEGTLEEDMDLIDVGSWDSITVMNFIVEFSKPGHRINLKDINNCETVGELSNLV